MKTVIQRVKSAKVVRVKDQVTTGQIEKGIFILVGFKKNDTFENVDIVANKISKLRIMADEKEKMNLSVLDTEASVLVVSQFTLYANTSGGNRPSFIDAEDPVRAKELYNYFVNVLNSKGIDVKTGSFGDYMEISAELDGPVTIIYE